MDRAPLTLARALRLLLGLAAGLLVLWAFADVAVRVARGGPDRPVELTILFWGDADEARIVDTVARAYERSHPRVSVRQIHADYGNYGAKLKTMMAAGTPPDLFYLLPEDLAEFADAKLIRPVTPMLDRASPPWFGDFYPQLLDAFRYDGSTVGGGPLYGLPKDFTTYGMHVNLDLFRRAGVPVPRDGWTWDQFADAARKITALNDVPGGNANGRVYGAYLNGWASVLRAIVWNHGGDFFATGPDGSTDFARTALESPPTREALGMVRRLRLDERTVYNPTGIATEGGQEFFTGNIGVIGPEGRWKTPRYRSITDFDWDFVPVPTVDGVPAKSLISTVAWGMSTDCAHPDDAYDLMLYLCGPEGAKMTGELGLAIPPLRSVAESDAFLQPGKKPLGTPAYLAALDSGVAPQYPRDREFGAILDEELSASLVLGTKTIDEAAADVRARWKRQQSRPLSTTEFPAVRWTPIVLVGGAGLLATLGLLAWKARRETLGPLDRRTERAGFSFIAPWVLGFAALTLGPMVLSLVLSFTRWSAMGPLGSAEWVGGANYAELLGYDDTFVQSLKVTLYYVVLAVPLTQAAALGVALLMNREVPGIGIFRTIYFVPSVISGVALGVLWLALFNNDFGLINRLLGPPLGYVGLSPPDWFGTDAAVAAIPAFVIMSLWGVGGGMVIYLAGLKGIPRSLYEAATIDGSGPVRKFWNVTLPMLSPLVFFNLVMGLIGSFQVFTQAFVMTGRGPANATLFYVLNLYYQAFEFHHMGYASAMAWVLFVLILLVTGVTFRASRRLVYYEGLS